MKKVLSVCLMLMVVAAVASAQDVARVGGLQEIWNFREVVRFNTNAANVSAEDQAILKRAADAAKGNAEAIISVEGHTDNRGNAVANQRLSERRAEAVRNVLVSRYGVNPRQIQVTGHGLRHPIASNDSADGMAKNRRVEVRIAKSGTPNIGSWTPWGTGDVTVAPAASGRTPQIGTHTPEVPATMPPASGRKPNVGPSTPPGDLTPITRR